MHPRRFVTLSPDQLTSALRKAVLEDAALDVCDLLQAGASAGDYAVPGGRETPLMAAARLGHADCVAHLVHRAHRPDWRASATQATALFLAAKHGHTQCVKILVRHSKCNLPGPDGYTPLMIAALNGHDDCVSALLTQPGVDVNAADPRGATAVSLAAVEGRAGCVQVLAAHADINKRGNMGESPLSRAIAGGRVECVRVLVAQPSINWELGLTRPFKQILDHAMQTAFSAAREAQTATSVNQAHQEKARQKAAAVAECLILVAERHDFDEVKALEAKIKPQAPRFTAWIEQQDLTRALRADVSSSAHNGGPSPASERRGMRL